MNFYSYRYALWHCGGRLTVAADAAINYTEHDNRYHHGNFDPKTMTCEMREAEAKGDLVDVLNAEQEEKDYLRKRQKEARRAWKAANRESAARRHSVNETKREIAARRSREIVRKSLSDLISREYTDEDRTIVDNALENVLTSKPTEVSLDEARNTADSLKGKKAKDIVKNLTEHFSSKFNGACDSSPIGRIELTAQSAHSIVTHNRQGMWFSFLAINALADLFRNASVFCVNPKWKGRADDSISLVAPMHIGSSDKVVEFTIMRKPNGRQELYNIKVLRKEEVEEVVTASHHHTDQPGKAPSSTTAHSIPNSQAEVNRHITEKSEKSETPKIPASNLVKQYLAAHGLLGQFLQK